MASRRIDPLFSDCSFGSRKAVTAIAESTGRYQIGEVEDEGFIQDLYCTSPSLQMISRMREISLLRENQRHIDNEIEKERMQKEFSDITNVHILEERIGKVTRMIEQLECVIRNRETVMCRLREPVVTDTLPVDFNHHRLSEFCLVCPQKVLQTSQLFDGLLTLDALSDERCSLKYRYMKEVVESIAPAVTRLPELLENLNKISSTETNDTKHLADIMKGISSVLLTQQKISSHINRLVKSTNTLSNRHQPS